MRRLLITAAAAIALAGCGPLQPPECSPTVVQPAPGAPITLIGRIDGCADLVSVAGPGPGTTLYVTRASLAGISDEEIFSLPIVQRGL
jgi:hypothetical protein